ncbi:glycosyltransferase family 4 protein [Rugosimonospora acidiphila]|uniref:glycosyltransferase family 4 protein n=1 Tax=Rugosimonospora acidiphila TaxID=556531 RepID=UPI0031F14B7A
MRVAIITESFPPDVNGVAHSVVRVAEHLVARGHRPLVIAPEPASGMPRVTGPLGYPVVRVPSLPMPGYPTFRLGLPSRRLSEALVAHGTDVVHLAGPFFLGARGSTVAQHLGLPTVAVYQTDVPSYATAYRMRELGGAAAWRWLRRIHNAADRTLAPSTASATALLAHGVERVWLWRRGVDTDRFDPKHRSAALRRALVPGGEVLVGYVGRLAVEKRVELLAGVSKLPGVRLVIIGGGPVEASLRQALPDAVFLGVRQGAQLARLYASLDIFVHSGPFETFGQTLQEAASSGLPVVAPAAGGPVDLVNHGQTGLLVPPNSDQALADAVARLAASPRLRQSMGVAGRRLVEGRSWTAIGDELIEHYSAVLGTAQPAATPAAA